ncbi:MULTISPECIES: pheA operon leader peptide PheL [Yersinia]|uniref:PheA operon leader peptide PheL n=1 Tax=Yersinia nurmii TaxID=685706 RepID=A0AAW7K8D7_9GAMM|nr:MULTISPECIES: pheA operon leader peptide PheL [Yersinia]MDN0089324.1 pheA operon leader peptide PheL [Yersinia nurmii]
MSYKPFFFAFFFTFP